MLKQIQHDIVHNRIYKGSHNKNNDKNSIKTIFQNTLPLLWMVMGVRQSEKLKCEFLDTPMALLQYARLCAYAHFKSVLKVLVLLWS